MKKSFEETVMARRVATLLKSRGPYPLARKYDVKESEIVNLASNESPYGPSPKVLKVLAEELSFIGRYPDPGARRLKRAIASYVGVGPECLTIGNGSDELMDLVCKAFLDQGEKVLIPIPTFELYEISVRLYGAKPVFFKLPPPDFEWQADGITRAAKGTKLGFLGRPNNPTGNGVGPGLLKQLQRSCGLVVLDEAYVEFAESSAAKFAAKEKNLVVLRTFSKAFGLAGLRVGYAVGNPKLVEVMERVRAPFNVNRLAQAAALAALEDLPYLRRVVGAIKQGRAYLFNELVKVGLGVLPSEANFLTVDVSRWGMRSKKFCDLLARRGIFVRDLSAFKGAGENYVRITVGTPQQNKKLVVELKKMKEGKKWS